MPEGERQKNARGSGACDTRAQDTARKTGKRAGGDCARRRRHGGRHESELNTVTGSCSYEPNSTKALKSLVSYIAPLRMTPRVPCLAMPGCSTAGAKKRKGPSRIFLKGREPQAACTDMPWRRERAPRRSPGRTPARAVARKNEEAPCRLGRGPRESSGDLLSRVRGPGTIGDVGLDFRVRDGNGYDPHSITAETNSAWNLDSLSNRQLCRS